MSCRGLRPTPPRFRPVRSLLPSQRPPCLARPSRSASRPLARCKPDPVPSMLLEAGRHGGPIRLGHQRPHGALPRPIATGTGSDDPCHGIAHRIGGDGDARGAKRHAAGVPLCSPSLQLVTVPLHDRIAFVGPKRTGAHLVVSLGGGEPQHPGPITRSHPFSSNEWSRFLRKEEGELVTRHSPAPNLPEHLPAASGGVRRRPPAASAPDEGAARRASRSPR